jgi:hypothetical protein
MKKGRLLAFLWLASQLCLLLALRHTVAPLPSILLRRILHID